MMKSGKVIPAFALLFFPVIVYLIYVISNSASLFFADDFHLLKTVLWVQDADGVFEKVSVLMQQHNEHRILFPRLLALLDYKIEGAINWQTLIVIGNLLWMANIWFFWNGFKSFDMPVRMFTAIPFIFLQPQYTDNLTWSISILQQSVIVFWFSLLTYLCSKNNYYQAMLVAIIAAFTHGNGIFSFFIGIILAISDRRWRTALIWAGVWILVAIIYFWNFRKGQSADFGRSLSDPLRLIMSFFAFFGSVTKIRTENVNYAVLLGFFLVAVLGVYLFPKLKALFSRTASGLAPFDKMLLGNVLFLGITGALIGISRSWAGIESVLTPRYQHYSPYVICWVYIVVLSFLNLRSRKIAAGFCIFFAVSFNALSYFTYNEQIQFRKNGLIADESNWINHSVMLNYVESLNKNMNDVYLRAVAEGISKSDNPFLRITAADTLTGNYNFDFFTRTSYDIDADGKYPHNFQYITNDSLTGKTYIYLKSEKETGYWLPTRIIHSGILEFVLSGNSSKPGFSTEFLTENFPAATYKIGLLNNDKFSWTSRTIQIK